MKRFIILILLSFIFLSCEKPVQWKKKSASSDFSFMTFEENDSESYVKNQLEKWHIDYSVENGKYYSVIETDWITWKKVEYAQIYFYFNEHSNLYKIRASINGEQNGKKLLDQMKHSYTESRIKGQKTRDNYFTGKNKQSGSLKYNKDEEAWSLEINFNSVPFNLY